MSIPFKLRDWIPEDKLDWVLLSENPGAIRLLEANPDKIDWINVSKNENAIHLIEPNLDKISWDLLSVNPGAIHLLTKNIDKINWFYLSKNPEAIDLLEQFPEMIDWTSIVSNTNPRIFPIIQDNIHQIHIPSLVLNEHALDLIINYNLISENISNWLWWYLGQSPFIEYFWKYFENDCCWYHISENPAAIRILEQNIEKICWSTLSGNPKAIHLLESNPQKICWSTLSSNPSIFEIDYHFLKERISVFKEELIQRVFHPQKLIYFLEKYNYDIGEDEYLKWDIFDN